MGVIVGIAIVWFIIEMLLWYLLAQFISGWFVFIWFIIAFFIGISMIRQGFSVLNPMAQQMKTGGLLNTAARPSENTIMKTVAIAIAGLLLAIPGLLSDFLALLIVLPPIQKKLKDFANNYAMNNQQKIMEMMSKQMGGGQNPFGNQNPFGTQNPFGNQNPFGSQNPFDNSNDMNNSPFGNIFKQNTTVDGTAKPVAKDVKKINKPANDE